MYSGAGKHFKVDDKNVFSTEIHPRSGIQSLYDHEGKQILRYNNTTRQVYNLFQDLWDRFIIFEVGYRVQSPFGAKVLQKDKYTGLMLAPDA